MADRKQCNGNCIECTIFQRQYCASQIAYNNMNLLSELMNGMEDLKRKIEAIQNNEASLINPIEQDDSAECGAAHKKAPETTNTDEDE